MPAQDDTDMTDSTPTIGALFAGFGGLDRAVEEVFGAEVVWLSEYDKAPSKILAHNYPDAPNHGDVTLIDWSTMTRPTIMTGGYPCFPTGTLILTRAGGWKTIEDVQAGDEVFTHANRWRPVLRNWGSHQAPTVTIKGQGHEGLVASDNHRFPVREKVTVTEGGRSRRVLATESVKVEAKDLAGKFWSTPTEFPADVAPLVHPSLGVDVESTDFLWVVGKYLADGCLTASDAGRHQYHAVRISDGRGVAADETKQGIAAAGLRFGVQHDRTADVFNISSTALATWLLEHFGHGAAEKTVAPWVYGLNEAQRRAIFDGYIHGDGHTIANGGVRFNTVSKKLAIGMRLLAQTLGYFTSINLVTPEATKVIEGRTVNQRPWWRVSCTTSSRTAVRADGAQWGKVKTVEYTGRTETVWNLEVADDHSYVVEGQVGQNCQPFSQAGNRLGSEDKRHLFPYFAKGIEQLRPRMVLAENVRGHLSLGFDIVMAEWVRVGYDVQWMLIKASDVGAPHGRARVFIFATDSTQVAPLAPKGTPVTELVDGVWSSTEDDLFGREPWTGRWPTAGRLVGGVVYDNTAELGNPRAAIARFLGAGVDVVESSGLLPSPTAALGSGGQTSRSGARKDELLLAGLAEAVTAGMLPTPRATRGGSGTETMYALGAERSDDDRPQGEVLLPTPVASLANGSTPSVDRSRVRATERGLKLDETVNVIRDDHRKAVAAAASSGGRVTVTASVDDDVPLLRTPQATVVDAKAGIKLSGRTPSDPQVGLADQVMALTDEMRLLKTPTAQLAINGGSQHPDKRKAGGHGPTLADEVEHLLPTPLGADSRMARNSTANRAGGVPNPHGGDTLTDVFVPKEDGPALLPTPTRQDGSNLGGPSQFGRNSVPLNAAVSLLPTPTTAPTTGNGHARSLGGEIRVLPTPRATDGEKGGPNQRGSSGDFMLPSAVHHMTAGSSALAADFDVDATLLPTPVVNDMGKAYTPEEWDAWTAKLKREHGNGNGHGKSLEIETARLVAVPVSGDVELLLTPMTAYTASSADEWRARRPAGNGGVRERVGDLRIVTEELLVDDQLLPTPTALPSGSSPESFLARKGEGREVVTDLQILADNSLFATGGRLDSPAAPTLAGYEQWGPYGPAIARWELVTGRRAPAATSEVKPGGAQRLSPVFVEWMMGQPEGWITSKKIGITRNEQLKACGNGVVTLQASTALRLLLATR